MTADAEGFGHERFFVRDISEHYAVPTYDLIFRDSENGVERFSESVWATQEQATVAADLLDKSNRRPLHWEVLRKT